MTAPRFAHRLRAVAAALAAALLIGATTAPAVTTQSNASWGLDRIDQVKLPLDHKYSYTSDGSGVTVYVIGSGIDTKLPEFGGRASWGADFADALAQDECGSGTAAASIVGGATYGVAKNVKLVAVKVLGPACGTPLSDDSLSNGLHWVVDYAVRGTPAIVLIALRGFGHSIHVNAYVDMLARAGIPTIVEAGDGGAQADACVNSPADNYSVDTSVIVASATTMADMRGSSASVDHCVTLLAPGVNVLAANRTGGATTVTSTSAAAAYTAGAAARILSRNTGLGTKALKAALVASADRNLVNLNCGLSTVCPQTPNLLLHIDPST